MDNGKDIKEIITEVDADNVKHKLPLSCNYIFIFENLASSFFSSNPYNFLISLHILNSSWKIYAYVSSSLHLLGNEVKTLN